MAGAGAPVIRVFLLDDHVMIRQMLRDRLGSEPDMEVVGEAGTAGAALPVVWSLRPEVAVLDIQLPDGDGVAVCRDIRSAVPETSCLMLTGVSGDEALLQAVLAGAAGYVSKEGGAADLLGAVRTVARGESALDERATKVVQGLLQEQPVERGLTEWDKQVFGLVAEGLTNWEIAGRLGVSVKQARADVLRVVSKLGPAGRQALGVTRGANR